MLKHKVNLDEVGLESANKAYGGSLDAFSFYETSFEDWLYSFRDLVLSKMGKEYFPIYRMADGEFRFVMGRKYNFYKKPLLKELVAVTAEKIRLKNPDKWKTSWGEEYSPEKVKTLRQNLIKDIQYIAQNGILACYYNTNGLHAFEEYNNYIIPFFNKNNIVFSKDNYIPFHFVCGILVKDGWQKFYKNRHVLIVTGSDKESENKIEETILASGAKKVSFLRISRTASMEEKIDLTKLKRENIDIVFVAAGIGSAHIIKQLEPLQTVTLDIGGYMNCFKDENASQHGGIFKLPF